MSDAPMLDCPVEILLEILAHLDVLSLMRCRQAHPALKWVIDGNPRLFHWKHAQTDGTMGGLPWRTREGASARCSNACRHAFSEVFALLGPAVICASGCKCGTYMTPRWCECLGQLRPTAVLFTRADWSDPYATSPFGSLRRTSSCMPRPLFGDEEAERQHRPPDWW
jgi:hypothetical protein